MHTVENIPHLVAEKLGFYVYLYIDPRTNKPFYVGKGIGARVLYHMSAIGESKKVKTINDLKLLGLTPRLEILTHDLPNAECAFRIESAVIDLFGLEYLNNEVRGWKSLTHGKVTLEELITYYAAEPITVNHPAILIRINKMYRRGITPVELFEATSGVWKVGARRNKAHFAFAVFEGVVREVFAIESWQPAGSNQYITRRPEEVNIDGRWEFTGKIAPTQIRDMYFGKSVIQYFTKGQRNPTTYVNC